MNRFMFKDILISALIASPIAMVLVFGIYERDFNLPVRLIVKADLSGLFFFSGVVVAIAALNNPLSHFQARLPVISGLVMTGVYFFITSMENVEKDSLFFSLAIALSLVFYICLLLMLIGTYMCFEAIKLGQVNPSEDV